MKTKTENHLYLLLFLLLSLCVSGNAYAQATATVTDSKEVLSKAESESDAETLTLEVKPGNEKKLVEGKAYVVGTGGLPWTVDVSSETLAAFSAKTPKNAPGKTYTSKFKGTFKGDGPGQPMDWRAASEIYVKDVAQFVINVDKGPSRSGRAFVINDSGTNSRKRQLDIGHATWKIEIPSDMLQDYPEDIRSAANKINGLTAKNSDALWQALLIAARGAKDGGDINVSVPGIVSSGRPGSEAGRFQIKPKETVETALTFTRNATNIPPDYAIPNYNCVDACIAAIRSAGKDVDDCRNDFDIQYNYVDKQGHKKGKILKFLFLIQRSLLLQ